MPSEEKKKKDWKTVLLLSHLQKKEKMLLSVVSNKQRREVQDSIEAIPNTMLYLWTKNICERREISNEVY